MKHNFFLIIFFYMNPAQREQIQLVDRVEQLPLVFGAARFARARLFR